MALSNLDGIVIDANPAYYQLYGYEPQDVIGQSFAVIFPEGVREWAEAHYRATFTQLEVAPTVATTIQRKDGVQRWVEVRYTFLTDATGQRTAMLSVIRDVTAQQLAQDALRASEARLRTAEAHYRGVFEGVEECILLANAQGRLLDVNPAAARLLGYDRADLLTMPIAAVLNDPVAASVIDDALSTDGAWRGETELRRADGHTVPIEGQAVLIPTADGPQLVMVARDITERRALEHQQREFLATIGHELKTPLTSIRGFAQLLQRRSPHSERATAGILGQTQRLARVVNDLLDLARLESRQLSVGHDVVAMNRLLERAVEDARVLAPSHTIVLTVPDDTIHVRGDADRLLQVLDNLLDNAVKYSPADSTIVVRLESMGDAVRISITDDGPGVSPAVIPRLFDRFYRTAAAREGSASGSGLGLAICKGLVEAHGGQIGAESTPGQGSTFWFTLPGA